MKDPLDTLLYQMPSPPPPENLADRIVHRVLAQKTIRIARFARWTAGILGSTGTLLLAWFFWEVRSISEVFPVSFSDGTAWWDVLGTLSATAFPLALALLALAAFLQVGYWLAILETFPLSSQGG